MKTAARGLFLGRALGAIFIFCISFAPPGFCAQSVPGEDNVGWFHGITHMHPLAYVLCILILALSIVNIWFQSRYSIQRIGAVSFWGSLKDIFGGSSFFSYEKSRGSQNSARKTVRDGKRRRSFRTGIEAVVPSEVVGVPRISRSPESRELSASIPTPLDGINHSLPEFSEIRDAVNEERENDPALKKTSRQVDFRFSSAVDFPTPEEMERRDQQQLTVSGFVKGIDGKALPSVLVYLTDLEGNRQGQSCRTLPDTGEYKVIAGEPGRYLLKAYKRGMIMEERESISLPLESGKLEGVHFRMIPDGCVVKGGVRVRGTDRPVPNTVVRCLSRLGDYSGDSFTDDDGNFTIVGVPPNCECFVEVIGNSGEKVHVSENFETVQRPVVELTIKIEPGKQLLALEGDPNGVPPAEDLSGLNMKQPFVS